MSTRLSTKEKQRIITQAVTAIIKKGPTLTAAMALEDALSQVAPRAIKEGTDKSLYLDMSNAVRDDLINQINAGVKAKQTPAEPGLCLCGCGGHVKKGSRFLQGHDARLVKNMVLCILNQADPKIIPIEAGEYLKSPAGKILQEKVVVQARAARERIAKKADLAKTRLEAATKRNEARVAASAARLATAKERAAAAGASTGEPQE